MIVLKVGDCSTENLFTERDLISFGLYMTSEQRERMLREHPDFDSASYEERSRRVYDADVRNWLDTQ